MDQSGITSKGAQPVKETIVEYTYPIEALVIPEYGPIPVYFGGTLVFDERRQLVARFAIPEAPDGEGEYLQQLTQYYNSLRERHQITLLDGKPEQAQGVFTLYRLPHGGAATRPNVNFGQAGTMWVGFQDQMRPVAWADIPICDDKYNCVPGGSAVDAAYLYLYVSEDRGYANWEQSRIDSGTAHALLGPWTEDGATWAAPWQTAGGDLGPALDCTYLGNGKVGYLRVMYRTFTE